MSYDEQKISDIIDGGLLQEKTETMLNDGLNIEVGQIFEVTSDDFYASKNLERISLGNFGGREAKFYLKKGEKIEIRFPFKWNYRTEDNIYFHSDNDYILSKCKLFGIVDEKIRSSNNASLEEILRLNLYRKTK